MRTIGAVSPDDYPSASELQAEAQRRASPPAAIQNEKNAGVTKTDMVRPPHSHTDEKNVSSTYARTLDPESISFADLKLRPLAENSVIPIAVPA